MVEFVRINMKKLLFSLLLTAGLALAQPAPTGFVAAGGGWNPYTTPQASGWASYGYLINEKQELYWFTTEDFTSSTKRPFTIQTSIRTGLATPLKKIGRITIMGLFDIGGASSSISSNMAGSTGSIILLRLTKNWYAVGGFRVLKINGTSGTPKLYEAGIGYTFK